MRIFGVYRVALALLLFKGYPPKGHPAPERGRGQLPKLLARASPSSMVMMMMVATA